MPGASKNTLRVTAMNANWSAGAHGQPGTFEMLIVTEDGERHTIAPAAESATALVALSQASNVVVWDADNRTLIACNLIGEWLPQDWSARPRGQHGPSADYGDDGWRDGAGRHTRLAERQTRPALSR